MVCNYRFYITGQRYSYNIYGSLQSTYIVLLDMHREINCTQMSTQLLSDAISQHVFFNFSGGGMPPESPGISMFHMLSLSIE